MSDLWEEKHVCISACASQKKFFFLIAKRIKNYAELKKNYENDIFNL